MIDEQKSVEPAADLRRLIELAVWLEGIKLGRGGNLEPMGTLTITELWKAIRELQNYRKTAQ